MAEGCDGARRAGLDQALGGPGLAWLRGRVRQRLERGQPLDGQVTLPDPTAEEAAAVERLLGRAPRGGKALRVRLSEVSDGLRRAGLAADVGEAVELLDGPVEDRAGARAARERRWREVLDPLDAAAAERPALGGWVASLRRTGLLRRLAGSDPDAGARLVADTLAVLAHLPHAGIRQPRLARQVLGSAHSLDDGRPVDTLVLGAIQALLGAPDPELERAEARRDRWAAGGVLVGDLTTHALVLNLPAGGGGVSDRVLQAGAAAGEPVLLSLGQLTRHPPELSALAGREVFVCENETVLGEAADRLGAAAAPLVCGRGQPTVAVMRLLNQIARAGAVLRYHGDFDWPGVAIANRVLRRTGALPWRYDAASYLAAAPRSRSRLTGRVATASFDPALRPAMQGAGMQVEEEDVLEDLLADLARSAPSTLH